MSFDVITEMPFDYSRTYRGRAIECHFNTAVPPFVHEITSLYC